MLGGGGSYNFGQALPPAGLSQVVAIAGSQFFSLALLSDGPPYFTVNPFSQSVIAGSVVTLTAFGTGPGPITYQWQYNGSNILGATNPLFRLANVAMTNAGSYRCVLRNASGSLVSAAATVTVTREPLRFDTSDFGFRATNGFKLRLLGLAGTGPVVVWASSNLLSWSPLLTNAPVIGQLELSDPDATNSAFRFYRATEGQ